MGSFCAAYFPHKADYGKGHPGSVFIALRRGIIPQQVMQFLPYFICLK